MTTEVEARSPAAPTQAPGQSEQLAAVPLGKPLDNLLQAVVLARGLIDAGIIPESLKKNPKDILVILIYGSELGLLPMQAVQGIYVVKGRPMLSAQLWATKIAEHRHRLSILESTNSVARVRITRGDNGEVFEETFTVEDAARAGFITITDGEVRCRGRSGDKLPWEQFTKVMLRYRALVSCARIACPEVCFGAGIHGEEYDEQNEPDMRPGNFTVEHVQENPVTADAVNELKALAASAKDEGLVTPIDKDVLDAEDAGFEAAFA